jgi:hypothetical protein
MTALAADWLRKEMSLTNVLVLLSLVFNLGAWVQQSKATEARLKIIETWVAEERPRLDQLYTLRVVSDAEYRNITEQLTEIKLQLRTKPEQH